MNNKCKKEYFPTVDPVQITCSGVYKKSASHSLLHFNLEGVDAVVFQLIGHLDLQKVTAILAVEQKYFSTRIGMRNRV